MIQSKPDSQPPSEERLKLLIANGGATIAQQLIDAYKLPYRIENNELKDALVGADLALKRFITVDPETLAMLDDVRRLSKCDDEVLITGETGTGKEAIARAMIGNRAVEKKGQFLALNCAGLPEQLVESELFGYVKGAFTGAEGNRQGLMLAAQEGVLFLDEIGELPLPAQAKLLRALQDKEVRRVGSVMPEKIACKVVCATHRNIKHMVSSGQFRQDLYARISTFELHVKPLRDRECDIIPIIRSLPGGPEFLIALEKNGLGVHKLDVSLNVRSLQQAVKRYVVLGRIIL